MGAAQTQRVFHCYLSDTEGRGVGDRPPKQQLSLLLLSPYNDDVDSK
jgi:hypothetical protein